MHCLLFYKLAEDYVERRPPLRGDHLFLAWCVKDACDLVLTGALADLADGAVFLFQRSSRRVAERFADADF